MEEGGVVLMKGLVGHEFDEDIDNGFRPAGLMRLSHTEVDQVVMLKDHSKVFDSGSATHRLTLYRSQKSNALVFGAGTCQWSWGLDRCHDSPAGIPAHVANPYVTRVGKDLSAPDQTVQQATANLFADMGVLPSTPLPFMRFDDGMPVVDHAGPMSVVDHIAIGAGGEDFTNSTDGGKGVVTLFGSASLLSQTPAAMIAAVEVSVDGGKSWHPATGMAEQDGLRRWQCSLTCPLPEGGGSLPEGDGNKDLVRCRAVDDLGVIGPVIVACATHKKAARL
jgi:hypothetical protein